VLFNEMFQEDIFLIFYIICLLKTSAEKYFMLLLVDFAAPKNNSWLHY